MQHPRFAALVAQQSAIWSRRTTLSAFVRGLATALAVVGGNGFTSDDAEATSCAQQCKKRNTARQRRKCRKKCDRPKPPNCDVCRAGCAFTSVQAAIDAAASGDTIRLCAGTFAEQLLIQEKDLTLTGAGDGEGGTTLDGRDIITGLVSIQDATVTLERLRITGAAGAFGGGISSQRSALTLTVCTVSGNTAAAGGGIFVEGGSLSLAESVVTGNRIGLIGGGIYFDSVDGALTLTNSRVEGNEAGKEGGGIALVNGAMTLTNSRVAGNTAGSGGGIYRFAGTATLQNSVVTGNTPDNCVGVSGCG